MKSSCMSWVDLSSKFHQYRSLYTKSMFTVSFRHRVKFYTYTAKTLNHRIKRQSVLAHEQYCPNIYIYKCYHDCKTCFVIARTRIRLDEQFWMPQTLLVTCYITLMTPIAFPTLLPIPFSPYRVVHMVSLSPRKEYF